MNQFSTISNTLFNMSLKFFSSNLPSKVSLQKLMVDDFYPRCTVKIINTQQIGKKGISTNIIQNRTGYFFKQFILINYSTL